jgi:hypothetical protein
VDELVQLLGEYIRYSRCSTGEKLSRRGKIITSFYRSVRLLTASISHNQRAKPGPGCRDETKSVLDPKGILGPLVAFT